MITMDEISKMIEKAGTSGKGCKEIADALYVFTYLKPWYFNLHFFNQDIKSEFLLSMYDFFKKITLYYEKDKSDLRTYLTCALHKNYISWLRSYTKKKVTEKEVCSYLQSEYLDSYCAEPEVLYTSQLDDEVIEFHDRICSKGLKRLLDSKSFLLFAFKSAYYFSNAHIKKIAKFTGYTEEQLWEYKHRIDAENARAIGKIEASNRTLNSAYILKNRYNIELSHLDPDSMHYEKIKKLYQKKIKLWNTKIQNRYHLSIPNQVLSNVFTEELATVTNVMSYARKLHRKPRTVANSARL